MDNILLNDKEVQVARAKIENIHFQPIDYDVTEWDRTICQAQLDKLANLTPKEVREKVEQIMWANWHSGEPVCGTPDICALITTQVEQAVKAERERIRKNR